VRYQGSVENSILSDGEELFIETELSEDELTKEESLKYKRKSIIY